VPLVTCGDSRVPSYEDTAPAIPALRKAPAAVGHRVRHYVDPQGSDAASGDSTAPFKTIQRAVDEAGPGDTVLVRPGVYGGGARMVSLSRSGSAGAWITIRSERPGRAILAGGARPSAEAWYFGPGVAYVRIEGFEIRDFAEHAFDTYGGGVHDIVIAHNRIHHIGRNCTDSSNGRTGASLGAGTRRVTLDGNVWRDIGRLAPGEEGCRPKTEYYQNHDHGIYVADADETTIINNVFIRFARGWAVHRYSSRGGSARGLLIANNTFVGANPYRPGQVILATPTADLRIENNIFYAPRSAALYFENHSFPNGIVRHNLVYGGVLLLGPRRGLTIARNWEGKNPRFVGPGNVRLSDGSPAIDVGLPLSEVPHDADGASRPRGAGYDLGAYER
jgi:hypothetical protein